MMKNSAAVLSILALVLAAPAARAQGFQWPTETKNMKVLPKTLVGPELGEVMRDFSNALGVRCSHCHKGDGPDLTKYDFASDDKPTKESARTMLKAVKSINENLLAGLPGEAGKRIQVKCMTCHRGLSKPRMLDDVLLETYTKDGLDATVAKYRDLRGEYYGGFSYDFGPSALVGFARRLATQGNKDAGLRFLDLNAEMFPDSWPADVAAARTYVEWGERDRAIARFEHALKLAPEEQKPAIQRGLDRLKNPPAPAAPPGH